MGITASKQGNREDAVALLQRAYTVYELTGTLSTPFGQECVAWLEGEEAHCSPDVDEKH